MVKTNNGRTAEADPNLEVLEIFQTQQSGILRMKIADIVKDSKLLKIARELAKEILKKDPNLKKKKIKL